MDLSLLFKPRKPAPVLGRTLFAYVAREFLFSLLVAFLFFFFLFFVNQMLVIAQNILSKNVDLGSTLLLIVYALPVIIALAVPFASLVGCIMAVGRFSSDNEMVAFQACGMSLLQILVPILVIALLVAVFSFIVNDFFLPIGTIKYMKLYQDLLYTNTKLFIEPYSITRFNNTTIISSQVYEGRLGPLLLIDTDEEGRKRVINADSGRILPNDEQSGIISLELEGVGVINLSKKTVDYDANRSGSVLYNMLLKTLNDSLRNPGPREMSSLDILDRLGTMEARRKEKQRESDFKSFLLGMELSKTYTQDSISLKEGKLSSLDYFRDTGSALEAYQKSRVPIGRDRDLQLYWMEFWKKFSFPLASFTLVFLGFPAGIFARRSGRSIGFGIGFFIAIIFWTMINVGQFIGMDNLALSPLMLMWAPNLLFLLIGVVLLAWRILR